MKDGPRGSELLFEMETCLQGVKTGTVLDSSGSDAPRFFLWPFCASGLTGCRMGMLSGLYAGGRVAPSVYLNATDGTFPILIEPAP